jgi:nitrate/nitrite transporter NarK
VNDAERELIAEGESPRSLTGSLSWKRAIRSRSLFCFTIQQFMDAGSDVAFTFLIGKYFLERHQTSMASAGLLTSLPLWGGALGGIVGGWLNDVVIRKSGNRRWARSSIGFVGKVIGCGMLFVASWQDDAIVAGIALFFAKFFSDWSQPTTWGTCTDMGGKCSATVFSIINTAGTISGIVMPIVFGKVLDWNTPLDELGKQMLSKTNWEPLFLLLAAMYLTSGIFWLLIDCTKSLDTKATEASHV